MEAFSLDQWLVLLLAFLLGLFLGMAFLAGGKWKRRYREEVRRREAIEADVVKAAAGRASAADTRELLDQVEAQKRVAESDTEGFMRLDDLFHRTLTEIAGIPFAWQHVKLAVLSLTPVGKAVVEV